MSNGAKTIEYGIKGENVMKKMKMEFFG